MTPTVMRAGPYRFFFNSREEVRRHVHVATPSGTAKFWLEPLVDLASHHNVPDKELRAMETLVKEHEHAFIDAWNEHFGQ